MTPHYNIINQKKAIKLFHFLTILMKIKTLSNHNPDISQEYD